MKIRPNTYFLCLFIVLTSGLWAHAALAQSREELVIHKDIPVVVELFTSTNCGACMEADRILYDLSKNKNVITLGCHVDYWDDQTLENPTGLEACTYRQWTYKASGMMSEAEVNVPYFIVNGRQSIDRDKIRIFNQYFNMESNGGRRPPLPVDLSWQYQETLYVTLPNTTWRLDDKDSYSVWLLRYQDSVVKKLTEGQTAGRVLRFSNVVKSSKHIAKWHGEKRTIEVPVGAPPGGNDRGGYVVMIHQLNGSDVIGAGKVMDYKMPDKKSVSSAAQPEVTPKPSQ
jgi:hypothetical protein